MFDKQTKMDENLNFLEFENKQDYEKSIIIAFNFYYI